VGILQSKEADCRAYRMTALVKGGRGSKQTAQWRQQQQQQQQ